MSTILFYYDDYTFMGKERNYLVYYRYDGKPVCLSNTAFIIQLAALILILVLVFAILELVYAAFIAVILIAVLLVWWLVGRRNASKFDK